MCQGIDAKKKGITRPFVDKEWEKITVQKLTEHKAKSQELARLKEDPIFIQLFKMLDDSNSKVGVAEVASHLGNIRKELKLSHPTNLSEITKVKLLDVLCCTRAIELQMNGSRCSIG